MSDESEPGNSPPDLGERLGAAVARIGEVLETRIAPALERIAAALERAPAGAVDPGQVARRASAVAEVRLAIADARWDHAEALSEGFARDFPDDPEAAALAAEVARGREHAIADRRAQLEASRSVNDYEAVLALHGELSGLLRGEDLGALDREVLRWLMGLIQRRMRAGTVRTDVARMAALVADRFGHTAEGASLRASLGVLRRSAGLCPRCGEPYAGVEAACPRCLAPGPDEAEPTEPDAGPT